MYRYTGILRLDGNVYNEVMKEATGSSPAMSAAEVMILRKLHGDDAFRDLQELPSDRSDYDEERARLMRIYVADGKLESRSKFNEVNFVTMFGPAHMQLPERLLEFKLKAQEREELEALDAEDVEEIETLSERMKRVRAARKDKKKAAFLAGKKINKDPKTNRRPNKTDARTPTLAELAG